MSFAACSCALIDAGRRMVPQTAMSAGSGGGAADRSAAQEATGTELYWRFLAAAVALAAIGLLFLRERAELWLQLGGAAAAAAFLGRWLW